MECREEILQRNPTAPPFGVQTSSVSVCAAVAAFGCCVYVCMYVCACVANVGQKNGGKIMQQVLPCQKKSEKNQWSLDASECMYVCVVFRSR